MVLMVMTAPQGLTELQALPEPTELLDLLAPTAKTERLVRKVRPVQLVRLVLRVPLARRAKPEPRELTQPLLVRRVKPERLVPLARRAKPEPRELIQPLLVRRVKPERLVLLVPLVLLVLPGRTAERATLARLARPVVSAPRSPRPW
jgi:hypothetical protein